MNRVRAMLGDRRRAQRGSVLSGVLIMTAFVAIISGALTTELSTNFLLSHNLMTRVNNQATVDSAIELTLSQLQTTPISQGCPNPGTATLNGRTAIASIVGCVPTVDSRSPQFITLAQSSAFNTGGAHPILPAAGLNDYMVGDSSGVLRNFQFGSANGWKFNLGGSVTAPPLAMVDPSGPPDVSILVASSNPTANGGCASTYCLALLSSDTGGTPSLRCYLPTGQVISMPAQGRSYPSLVYVGDLSGTVTVVGATEDGGCVQQASSTGTRPIVAGPFVFPGPVIKKAPSDVLYVVASDSNGSELDEYLYSTGKLGTSFTFAGSLTLPAVSAVGAAVDQGGLPARVAVTFAGGGVVVAGISAGFAMSLAATTALPTAMSGAPNWCQCPGGVTLAVGGRNGALFLLDPTLGLRAFLPSGGPAISTAPQSDGVGEWFYGADDGYLYELQQQAGKTLAVVGQFGPFDGAVTSGVQVGGCPEGLCAYLASGAGTAYVVQLDARNVIITACISTSPPACSGDNPRAWASVQVGVAGNLQTVHVEGWSYYSP
jgi:hypothetical protein